MSHWGTLDRPHETRRLIAVSMHPPCAAAHALMIGWPSGNGSVAAVEPIRPSDCISLMRAVLPVELGPSTSAMVNPEEQSSAKSEREDAMRLVCCSCWSLRSGRAEAECGRASRDQADLNKGAPIVCEGEET